MLHEGGGSDLSDPHSAPRRRTYAAAAALRPPQKDRPSPTPSRRQRKAAASVNRVEIIWAVAGFSSFISLIIWASLAPRALRPLCSSMMVAESRRNALTGAGMLLMSTSWRMAAAWAPGAAVPDTRVLVGLAKVAALPSVGAASLSPSWTSVHPAAW